VTSPLRRILATSGGFAATDRYRVLQPGALIKEALRLTGKDRPTVCLVMTASSDDAGYLLASIDAFRGWSVDVTHLRLAHMPNDEPSALLLGADLVWVGGGSVANLLALWRLHGVDEAMREAWEAGVILGGVSAGSICWHVGGPTDSFGPTLQPVTNALGFLPYGNGVHYDSEEQRRPLLQKLVGDGTLPTSYATDDRVGILYEGIDPVQVITDLDEPGSGGPSAADGPAAYRVERSGGEVVETRLGPGRL
jgi:peptidase E